MNCPKCKLLLFGKKDHYSCMGCGLWGTYPEMERQAEQTRARITERAIRVECKICKKRKILATEIISCTRNGKTQFVCYDCQKMFFRNKL